MQQLCLKGIKSVPPLAFMTPFYCEQTNICRPVIRSYGGYLRPCLLRAHALYQAQLALCDPLGIFAESVHRGNVVLICQAVSLSTA